ncbi:MAG: DapH/DapD/GlmU-related protein [Succiniclasticum sp.]|jgi:acetyltransferase-like isoleucine patch superfamily enzyme
MNVFEEMRAGKAYDIRDPHYLAAAHVEFDRCARLCQEIRNTDPADVEKIKSLEKDLTQGTMPDDSYLIPPFDIDCGCRVFVGHNVLANHHLTVMSVGTVTIEDGVMMGPGVGLFTVNHEPRNIRTIMTKEIRIKKNAWIGARVSILPGVTIGEGAIIGTGSVVTKDIPDYCVAVGNPARVIKQI